ncbi:MAG: hypothetical protein ACXAEU_23750 [Candidatus Hodarchaeales archaeon]|jgi:hypothetical protein
MIKVPEIVRMQILEILNTPKRIHEVSEEINKSWKMSALYLRMMWKDGELKKVADFKDLRSFLYVKC